MKKLTAAALPLLLISALEAQDVTEPRSGAKFAAKDAEMTLTGVGLRTKTFLKAKVYAVGLSVADSALAGSLAPHRGKPKNAAFYKELVWGDFAKQIQMKFVRDLSTSQIQEAFREALAAAERAKVDQFVGYFGDIKSGQDCVLKWGPGGTLKTTVAGVAKPPIADMNFAAAVFGIWLGERPIQDDIKQDLVKSF